MRRLTLPLALLAVLALTAAVGTGTASARSCKSAAYPGEGYFNDLNVRNTSCRRGREVQRLHYRCRLRNGGKDGYCRRVEGYRCTERRGERTRVEYNARVRCTRSTVVISWQYQQNL